MLLKKIIFIFIFFISTLAIAQGGFRKKYYPQNSIVNVCGDVVESPNGDLIMIGLTYDTLNNHSFNRLTLIGTDALGNEQWRKDYGNYNFEYLDVISKSSVIKENNFFYLIIVARDTTFKQFGALLKINYSGDTLWQKVYHDPTGELLTDAITKSVDGALLVTGTYQNPLTQQPLLVMKLDLNGNVLWKKYINKALPNEQLGGALVQDVVNKKIVVVGFQYIATTGIYSEMSSDIVILDSLGNPEIQTTFNNVGGGAFDDVIQLQDGNFLTGGAWSFPYANNGDNMKALLVKFDSNGSVIWKKIFDEIGIYNRIMFVSERANEDIIVEGISANATDQIKPTIFRIDKNGNVIWKKTVGTVDQTDAPGFGMERASSLNKSQNGGYFLSTAFEQHINPKPYSIIKIDSTACDTTEAYCRSVILGISNFKSLTGYNFELFPNPANEFVILKIDAPFDKSFIIKITDVSGRDLKTFTMPAESYTLDLLEFKAGVYFASVFYESKLVETKRILVVRE